MIAVAVIAFLGVAGGWVALDARTDSPRATAASASDRTRLRLQIVNNDSAHMRRLARYVERDADAQKLGIQMKPDVWAVPSADKRAYGYYLTAAKRETLASYLAALFRRRSDLGPEPGHEILLGQEQGRWRTYYLWTRIELDGSLIARAEVEHDGANRAPAVRVWFDEQGKARLAAVSGQNVGRKLVLIVNGVVVWAPILESPLLGGSIEISGVGTDRASQEQKARELARSLSRGR